MPLVAGRNHRFQLLTNRFHVFGQILLIETQSSDARVKGRTKLLRCFRRTSEDCRSGEFVRPDFPHVRFAREDSQPSDRVPLELPPLWRRVSKRDETKVNVDVSRRTHVDSIQRRTKLLVIFFVKTNSRLNDCVHLTERWISFDQMLSEL